MNGLADNLATITANPALAADAPFGVASIIILALAGIVTGWILILLVLWYWNTKRPAVRAGEFHHSNADHEVPRYGGVALAGTLIVSGLLFASFQGWQILFHKESIAILVTSMAMFGVGFWDDLRSLGAKKKLLMQIVVALIAYALGLQITTFKNPFTDAVIDLHNFSIVVTVVWLVAMTNLVNLVDGIDGLAGGVSFMLMCLLAYVSMQGSPLQFAVATSMAGALIAFLRFNFPPARIYMGDGGAYFLGCLIGAMTLANSHKGTVLAAMIAPVIALGLPIIDTSLAIVRRGLQGLPLFRADRKHLHHRLMQRGLSRTKTVLLLYAVSVVFLLMAFAMFWSERRYVPIVFGMAFLIFLFMLQGRAMGLDWLTVGRLVGNSRELRRHTQYVMTLGCWLEMEAERAPTLEALWEDFTFVARKIGFTRAKVVLADGHRTWVDAGHNPATAQKEHSFEFNPGTRMLLIFQCSDPERERNIMAHLSELAAEAWLKAALRWRDENQKPLSLAHPPTTTNAAHLANAQGAVTG
ncbi:MAG: hypothetical protein RLY20_2861 [Verrucomicrobiota bacterium]